MEFSGLRKRLLFAQSIFHHLDRRPYYLSDLKTLADERDVTLIKSSAVPHGVSVIEHGRPIIIYNPEQHPMKLRHILAHELAHVLLDHHARIQDKALMYQRGPDVVAKVEAEADRIASASIFPRTLMMRYYLGTGKFSYTLIRRYLTKTCPITAPKRDVDRTVNRLYKHIAQEWRLMRMTCQYGRQCAKGEICPWLRAYYL